MVHDAVSKSQLAGGRETGNPSYGGTRTIHTPSSSHHVPSDAIAIDQARPCRGAVVPAAGWAAGHNLYALLPCDLTDTVLYTAASQQNKPPAPRESATAKLVSQPMRALSVFASSADN